MSAAGDAGLRTIGVSKSFGGLRALSEVDLAVEGGRISGLIGPNGAGKSTLLSILAGEQSPTSGRVLVGDRDVTRSGASTRSRIGVARTFQNLRLFRESTVLENVMVGSRRWSQARVVDRFTGRRHRAALEQAESLLQRVGLPEQVWGRQAGGLPYIQQRLLEIARCLATEPAYLLLDEPVAGANDQERDDLAELTRSIAREGVGVLIIEHDMAFLFRLVEAVTVLDHGVVIGRGAPDEIRRDQAVIDAYLGAVEQ